MRANGRKRKLTDGVVKACNNAWPLVIKAVSPPTRVAKVRAKLSIKAGDIKREMSQSPKRRPAGPRRISFNRTAVGTRTIHCPKFCI